jgi:hypothetical protein
MLKRSSRRYIYHEPSSTMTRQCNGAKICQCQSTVTVNRDIYDMSLRKEYINQTPAIQCRHVIHFARLITCLHFAVVLLQRSTKYSTRILLHHGARQTSRNNQGQSSPAQRPTHRHKTHRRSKSSGAFPWYPHRHLSAKQR